MSTNLQSIPQSGIKSINGVSAPAGNVSLVSSDGTVLITPNSTSREINLQTTGATRTDIVELPCVSALQIGEFSVVKNGIADRILLDGSYPPVLYGICIDKASPTVAVIQISGLTPTLLSGLTDGASYFGDDTGTITTTVPVPGPGLQRYLVSLGVAVGTNRIFLQNKQPVLRNG